MKKNILIIGAGISGCALLHYLNQRTQGQDVVIHLLEKNTHPGGTIHTVSENGLLFETGPNGFLDSKPTTKEFLTEIGLENAIIPADESAKKRFILVDHQLMAMPNSLGSFIKFKGLKGWEKWRMLRGIFQSCDMSKDLSIYDYGKQQFGARVSDLFIDAFVKGVYGADAKDISLKAAFPKLYTMHKESGSLWKALKAAKKKRKLSGEPKKSFGGKLNTLEQGMGSVIHKIHQLYAEQIHCDQNVDRIVKKKEVFHVQTTKGVWKANQLYLCTPAYIASALTKEINPNLSRLLDRVTYSAIGVVGLCFEKKQWPELPEGFGYLIPSINQKQVLGVLFESNIFSGRCDEQNLLLRVMVGMDQQDSGAGNKKDKNVSLALQEVKERFKITGEPQSVLYREWNRAIPEYNMEYQSLVEDVQKELDQEKNLKIVANYWKGISFNDCIANAKEQGAAYGN